MGDASIRLAVKTWVYILSLGLVFICYIIFILKQLSAVIAAAMSIKNSQKVKRVLEVGSSCSIYFVTVMCC